MSYQTFIKDATRTESRIEAIECDEEALKAVLNAAIAIGEMMDSIKKNVFYGKEVKNGDFSANARKLTDLGHQLNTGFSMRATDKKPIDIDPRVFHAIVGKFTESVELVQAMVRGIETGTLDVVNVKEELGDDQWYNAILCDALDLDMDDVLDKVIGKLKIRYPEKFTSEAAIERNLSAERDHLEGPK